MYYYANGDFPKLLSYEQALNYYNQKKPYTKGKNKGLSPLRVSSAGRRSGHYRIAKVKGDVIVVQVHHTDVIEYHPDGLVRVCTGGWNSQTTSHVLTEVLCGRVNTWFGTYNGHFVLSYTPKDGKRQYVPFVAEQDWSLSLRMDDGSISEVINPPTWYRPYVRRSNMTSLRKKYAEPIKYITSMAKLQDPFEIGKQAHGQIALAKCAELLGSKDASDWWQLAGAVYKAAVCQTWEYGQGYIYTLPAERVKGKITEMLKAVFGSEVVELRKRPAHLQPSSKDIAR